MCMGIVRFLGIGFAIHRFFDFPNNPIEFLYHVTYFLFTSSMLIIHLVASLKEHLQLFHHPRINITIVPGPYQYIYAPVNC